MKFIVLMLFCIWLTFRIGNAMQIQTARITTDMKYCEILKGKESDGYCLVDEVQLSRDFISDDRLVKIKGDKQTIRMPNDPVIMLVIKDSRYEFFKNW